MRRRTMLAFTLSSALVARAANAAIPPIEVAIDNFAFVPAQLTVAAGSRVAWINRDDSPHTVVDRDNPQDMRSPPLDTGDRFIFAFDQPGTYHYFCSLHPHMQGTVVVR